MTQIELTVMQDLIQHIYNRMGDENITDMQYRDYRTQIAGMTKMLKAIGYIVEKDGLGVITIERRITK